MQIIKEKEKEKNKKEDEKLSSKKFLEISKTNNEIQKEKRYLVDCISTYDEY